MTPNQYAQKEADRIIDTVSKSYFGNDYKEHIYDICYRRIDTLRACLRGLDLALSTIQKGAIMNQKDPTITEEEARAARARADIAESGIAKQIEEIQNMFTMVPVQIDSIKHEQKD